MSFQVLSHIDQKLNLLNLILNAEFTTIGNLMSRYPKHIRIICHSQTFDGSIPYKHTYKYIYYNEATATCSLVDFLDLDDGLTWENRYESGDLQGFINEIGTKRRIDVVYDETSLTVNYEGGVIKFRA